MESRNYSDQTAQLIDEEERRIVGESYKRAISILTEKHQELERIASALIQKETLSRKELDQILAAVPDPMSQTVISPPSSTA